MVINCRHEEQLKDTSDPINRPLKLSMLCVWIMRVAWKKYNVLSQRFLGYYLTKLSKSFLPLIVIIDGGQRL